MRKSVNIGDRLLPLTFIIGLIIFWQWAVGFFHFAEWILPAPSQIFIALIDSFDVLLDHTKITLGEAALGLTAAVFLAGFLALLMDSFSWVKKSFYPILISSQTVPIITVAPLFVIWFGYGILPKVIVVTLVCFFPMVISLLDGLASVDDDLINLLKTMGASRRHIFFMVKLPGSLPCFFSGLKISVAYSIMGAVIGEWLGASKGLGIFMSRAQHSFKLPEVFAAILVITILSFAFLGLVKLVEKICMPWVNVGKKQ
ncbi:MAG: ABC transporter permease [Bacillota bacterium]|jgi:ABC-type nitrate/sulfonate/bicarbonate transport system permease component